jgi:hypothetical protein
MKKEKKKTNKMKVNYIPKKKYPFRVSSVFLKYFLVYGSDEFHRANRTKKYFKKTEETRKGYFFLGI